MMTRSCSINALVVACLVYVLPALVARAEGGDVMQVPPFKISQKDLLQQLGIGENIKLDVPGLYVFGDSTIDAGNNVLLNEQPVRLPYGIDFDGGEPTGRATNGRTEADFIAQVLGLPFPPPSLSLKDGEQPKTGVNYGSGGCGILPYDGNNFGKCLSLDSQINAFENTVKILKDQFSNSSETFESYISKSLFFINTANNDLGLIYQEHQELRQKYSDILGYAKFVCREFSPRLERLYKLGARKFLVNGAGALGCAPFNVAMAIPKPTTQCDENTNAPILEYNSQLSQLLPKLQSTLPGSKFVLGNVYTIWRDILGSPESYGIKNTKEGCCVDLLRNQTRPCDPSVPVPCKDRNDHVFFDPFLHPTEAVHFIFLRRCLKETSICSPINLAELLQA